VYKFFVLFLFSFTILFAENKNQIKLETLFSQVKECSIEEKVKFDETINNCSDFIATSFSDSLKAIHYRTLGKICYQKANFSNAKNFFSKSKDFYFAIKDTINGAKLLSNVAIVNEINGEYEKAVETYFEVMKFFEKKNNRKGMSGVALNLSNVYFEMDNIPLAMKYQKKSLALKKEVKDTLGVALLYTNIANLFVERFSNTDSASFYLKKSAKLLKAINEKKRYMQVLQNIAMLKLERKEYKEARKGLNEVLLFYKKDGDQSQIINTLWAIGVLNYFTENQNEAEKNIKECLRINKKIGNEKNSLELHNQLSLIYEKQEKYKLALEELADMESKYENIKKEKQIESQNHKLELQKRNLKEKNLFIVVAVLLLIILIILGYFYFRFQHKKNIMEKNESDQKLLKSQMNPHFIFNALASIQNYMLSNEPKKASSFLSNFSSLSRAILTNSSKEAISLEEEIKMTTDYLILEKMRKSGGFDYNVIFDEEEDIEFISIPPMMIQPFIENAIKHGLANVTEKGQIDIKFTCLEKLVQIEVVDNGIGIDSKTEIKDKQHKSMAMDIFKKRVVLLEKKYKTKLKYSSTDLKKEGKHGTKIYLELPIVE